MRQREGGPSGVVVTIALLGVVGSVLTWAVVGSRGEGSSKAGHAMTPATAARVRGTSGPSIRTAILQPSIDTGDYVVVDSVVSPDQLIVHTTRGPGHDLTPYVVIISPNTIVHPLPDASTQVVGRYDGVAPGDEFYFGGTTINASPGHRIVQAVRIFVGL
jgi:hypothetical protein